MYSRKGFQLELKGLVFFAYHGALPEEAVVGQRFQVDVLVSLNPDLDLAADATRKTVNYADVYEAVSAVFLGQRFNLIESCADRIGEVILDRFAAVSTVSVKVKKPSVPVDCVCDYFAAEVTLSR